MIRKIANGLSTVVMVLVVLLALTLVGGRLFGMQTYAVLSGSMEPADIQPGQVITFLLDEHTVATHRVVEVIPDPEEAGIYRYRTKGDANEAADAGLVHCRNVLGTPVASIPYLGYVITWIQNPPGTYIAISAAAVLLLLVFLPDLFAEDKKKPAPDAESR